MMIDFMDPMRKLDLIRLVGSHSGCDKVTQVNYGALTS
jgi:hypothetical protein